jgi:hypothetical protein
MCMSFYPTQFQPQELAAHLISALERRRASFEIIDESAEAQLNIEADNVFAQAKAQFKELADDEAYWARTEESVRQVALARYIILAKKQTELEKSGFGAWRGGDVISRVAYAGAGLLIGLIIIRTPIPDWLEFMPLGLFIFGPLIPDIQSWSGKRKYAQSLGQIVDDMKNESIAASTYAPIGDIGSMDSNSAMKSKEKA